MNSFIKNTIEDDMVNNTLKILDYSKANKKWFDERGFVAGYHSFTLNNQFFKGQRNIEERVCNIDEKYYLDKNILDIGCSTGGLLYHLSNKINKGVGVDFNTKCINAANLIKNNFNLDNLSFYTFDLDKENLDLIKSFTNSMKVDLCFFMNLSLWVKKWKEAFTFLADIAEIMVFEAHGNPSQQEEQLSFIKSVYREVELVNEQSSDDESYLKRSMYICKDRITGTETKEVHQISSYDIEPIGEFYKKFFGTDFNKIYKFNGTHESHVFEIDGYILKFPRAKDYSYINKEIKLAQLLKDRVGIKIPEIYIYEADNL
ncbi:class I SAM-dependent methyltransferase, partial [Acinetobacter proteolyticus]|uniref:class I SAM-dependent methyltransferase n=3 Tax=Acinetobacter TaxID=469 RepID=UPI00135B055B